MKKTLFLAGLFFCAGLFLRAQTQAVNAASGTVSVGCSDYTDNANRTWNVNIGQNACVKMVYSIHTEANFDWVTVYSVDASGGIVQLFSQSGTASGTIYSAFPTGKIQIVFTTNDSVNCSDNAACTGFSLSFEADDRVVTLSSYLDNIDIWDDNPEDPWNPGDPEDPEDEDTYIDYQQNLYFRSSGNAVAATLTQSGNLGIGIPNPTHRLEVNGTLRAKEVKIETTGWPDFVFSPDYQLPSLEQVAGHIREFQHLPQIPSAGEVAEQGISLGEMQVKLLQKIEELTLYLIEQDRTIQGLKAEINLLKEK